MVMHAIDSPGVNSFVELSDVPHSYSGATNYVVVVNASGTGLTFVPGSTFGSVTSVSNSDSTLTVTPTTGAVVASLNLTHANTWTGQQTFNTSAPIIGTGDAQSLVFLDSATKAIKTDTALWYDFTNKTVFVNWPGTAVSPNGQTFLEVFNNADITMNADNLTSGVTSPTMSVSNYRLGGGYSYAQPNINNIGDTVGSFTYYAVTGTTPFTAGTNAFSQFASMSVAVTGSTAGNGSGTWSLGTKSDGGALTTRIAVSDTSVALTLPINETQGATLASASTVNIGAATGNYLTISGTTTITAFDTVQAGTRRIIMFSGALVLTHNATSLILPGGANITTANGDVATFVSLGSGNWRCVGYSKVTTTGTGSAVFSVAPTFTGTTTLGAIITNNASTQSLAGVTINIGGNSTTTTANILGGATVNTATSTVNINQGATASGGIKVVSIATQGLAGSTTTIAIGSALGTSVITFAGQITLSDTTNIATNATTGTKIATATTQKIGFWNTAPIVQPTTAIIAATFVANTSAIANDTATWDGYTIGQVVKALRNAGLLA